MRFILLDKTIKIKWNTGNKNVFMNAGYNFTKLGDEFTVNVDDLSPNSTCRVNVICDYCHKKYDTQYANYLHGIQHGGTNACSNCAGKKTKELSWKKRALESFEKLYKICYENDYTLLTELDEYTNQKMMVKYICPKHGLQTPMMYSLLHGHICIQCSYEKRGLGLRFSQDEVKNIIESVNDNHWLNYGEYKGSFINNLEIKCNCGNKFTLSLSNYKFQNRCNICSHNESSGEILIRKFLESHNILFIQEKRFYNCRDVRPLPFDFYLPKYNLIIEFDGQHHFQIIYDAEHYEITKKHDNIKNQYCKDNNIELLRIPYWKGDKIAEIIQNKINEIGERNSLVA